MKVCTDSCVFGSWIANKLQNIRPSPKIILDIGTGTGLLSLMVAQKCETVIHAIDSDKNAMIQAGDNFKSSSWNDRLHALCGDVKERSFTCKYDAIISNPPFYEDDLLPPGKEKMNSKHSNKLRLNELILTVDTLLQNDGIFGVLLPYNRAAYFENEAIKYSLFVREKLQLRQSVKHNYFRTILILNRKKNNVTEDELSIRNAHNEYTNEFIELLKDYYLYL